MATTRVTYNQKEGTFCVQAPGLTREVITRALSSAQLDWVNPDDVKWDVPDAIFLRPKAGTQYIPLAMQAALSSVFDACLPRSSRVGAGRPFPAQRTR